MRLIKLKMLHIWWHKHEHIGAAKLPVFPFHMHWLHVQRLLHVKLN